MVPCKHAFILQHWMFQFNIVFQNLCRKCQLIQKRLEVARNRQVTANASFSTSSGRQFSPCGRPPQEGEDGGGIQNRCDLKRLLGSTIKEIIFLCSFQRFALLFQTHLGQLKKAYLLTILSVVLTETLSV